MTGSVRTTASPFVDTANTGRAARTAFGALLLREPDFGAFVVIISIAMGILFLGGINARLFSFLFVFLMIAFVVLIWTSPYRRERIFGFMDPWQDEFGRGYDITDLSVAEPSLETVFINLTGKDLRE